MSRYPVTVLYVCHIQYIQLDFAKEPKNWVSNSPWIFAFQSLALVSQLFRYSARNENRYCVITGKQYCNSCLHSRLGANGSFFLISSTFCQSLPSPLFQSTNGCRQIGQGNGWTCQAEGVLDYSAKLPLPHERDRAESRGEPTYG